MHRFIEEMRSPLGVRLYSGYPHYDRKHDICLSISTQWIRHFFAVGHAVLGARAGTGTAAMNLRVELGEQ